MDLLCSDCYFIFSSEEILNVELNKRIWRPVGDDAVAFNVRTNGFQLLTERNIRASSNVYSVILLYFGTGLSLKATSSGLASFS